MYYQAPKDEKGNPYWVPIVVKSKDFLVGYIFMRETIGHIVDDITKGFGVNIQFDVKEFDHTIDSSRFNDLMPDGKELSKLSQKELAEYFEQNLKSKIELDMAKPDDSKVFEEDILVLKCSCNLGVYSFKHIKDIPEEDFCCTNCGKKLIHYTGKHDYDYEYQKGEKDADNKKG